MTLVAIHLLIGRKGKSRSHEVQFEPGKEFEPKDLGIDDEEAERLVASGAAKLKDVPVVAPKVDDDKKDGGQDGDTPV